MWSTGPQLFQISNEMPTTLAPFLVLSCYIALRVSYRVGTLTSSAFSGSFRKHWLLKVGLCDWHRRWGYRLPLGLHRNLVVTIVSTKLGPLCNVYPPFILDLSKLELKTATFKVDDCHLLWTRWLGHVNEVFWFPPVGLGFLVCFHQTGLDSSWRWTNGLLWMSTG